MKIHILGICGTFMGGIAAIARELGHEVSGSDQNVYPPMSDTLAQLGVTLMEGYEPSHLQPKPDLVIIGNALSRGNPAIEYVLNEQIPYTSGPEWLADHVLQYRHVLAISGTHGKTSTTAMLTWILEFAGLKPGYLIGGVAQDFKTTARLGKDYFVIEADEYDTAFFDKRSKFLHYRPRTLVMNNLEFDHADIFPDLNAIKLQFQYLLRTVPANGLVISNGLDHHVQEVLSRGCFSKHELFGATQGWQAKDTVGKTAFDVYFNSEPRGHVAWAILGRHNQLNALAAIAAAHDIGVPVATACEALTTFKGVKRRLEIISVKNGITIYDDFAHHPTAIRETLQALRKHVGRERIIAVLQFGSNTMKMGGQLELVAPALAEADQIIFLEPEKFDVHTIMAALGEKATCFKSVDDIVQAIRATSQSGDHVLITSNKSFDGLHGKLLES